INRHLEIRETASKRSGVLFLLVWAGFSCGQGWIVPNGIGGEHLISNSQIPFHPDFFIKSMHEHLVLITRHSNDSFRLAIERCRMTTACRVKRWFLTIEFSGAPARATLLERHSFLSRSSSTMSPHAPANPHATHRQQHRSDDFR